MSISPNLTYIVSAVLIKIPWCTPVVIEKLTLKFIIKGKGTKIANTIFWSKKIDIIQVLSDFSQCFFFFLFLFFGIHFIYLEFVQQLSDSLIIFYICLSFWIKSFMSSCLFFSSVISHLKFRSEFCSVYFFIYSFHL